MSCDWLIPLRIMSSGFIRGVAGVRISFLFEAESPLCLQTVFCSPVTCQYRAAPSSWLLRIMPPWTWLSRCLCDCFRFLWIDARSGGGASYADATLKSLRDPHTSRQLRRIPSPPAVHRVPASHGLVKTCFLNTHVSWVLTAATLMGVRRGLTSLDLRFSSDHRAFSRAFSHLSTFCGKMSIWVFCPRLNWVVWGFCCWVRGVLCIV